MTFKRVTIGLAEVDFTTSSIVSNSGFFSIEPKVMKVLHALVINAGSVVDRPTLIKLVWGSPYGSDQRLFRAISLLRKALGDAHGNKQHIETIPKGGYRLIAPLKDVSNADELPPIKPRPSPILSIAVLPFVDMSEDQDQSYLADGVSEEIINALVQAPKFKVAGRTSSFAFKNRNEDIREIARALNVAYVVEGSVRKVASKLRITAQLIRSSDGFHLFSKTYDGELSDIFDFQDRIAYTVVNEVHELFDLENEQSVQKKFTKNAEAYECFLRGRQLVHQLNGQNTIPTGIAFLEKAIKQDPDFALAWAWLALARLILPEFSRTRDWISHLEQSRKAVDTALTLEPELSMGLLVQAMIFARDGRFDLSVTMHKQALEVDPNNIETLAGMGLGLMAIGLWEDAKPYFDRVIEQDPLCGIWKTTYAGLLIIAGEHEKAEASFRRSFELGFGPAAFGLSHQMMYRGKTDQAVEFIKENLDGIGPTERAELKSPLVQNLVFNAMLRKNKVAQFFVHLGLKQRLKNTYAQPTSASVMGFFYLDRPKDFMRAISEKPNPYIGYAVARIWEPTQAAHNIRTHAGFADFVQRVGFIEAWRQHGWPKQLVPVSEGDDSGHGFSVVS